MVPLSLRGGEDKEALHAEHKPASGGHTRPFIRPLTAVVQGKELSYDNNGVH